MKSSDMTTTKTKKRRTARTVKPQFYDDLKVGRLSRDARYLYIAMMVFSDSLGVVNGDSAWLKSRFYPYDQIGDGDFDAWLDELISNGLARQVYHDGEKFLYLPNLERLQGRSGHVDLNIPESELDAMLKQPVDGYGLGQGQAVEPPRAARVAPVATEEETESLQGGKPQVAGGDAPQPQHRPQATQSNMFDMIPQQEQGQKAEQAMDAPPAMPAECRQQQGRRETGETVAIGNVLQKIQCFVETGRIPAVSITLPDDRENAVPMPDGMFDSLSKRIQKSMAEQEGKAKRRKTLFTPPTVDEVLSYVKEKGYSVDAEQFVNFYESKNWMVGKNRMSNWHAAVATWQKRENEKEKENENNRHGRDDKRGVLEIAATGADDYTTSF